MDSPTPGSSDCRGDQITSGPVRGETKHALRGMSLFWRSSAALSMYSAVDGLARTDRQPMPADPRSTPLRARPRARPRARVVPHTTARRHGALAIDTGNVFIVLYRYYVCPSSLTVLPIIFEFTLSLVEGSLIACCYRAYCV